MKNFLLLNIMILLSLNLHSQELYGTWEISDYSIEIINKSISDDVHKENNLNYSCFQAIIENNEKLVFNKDNSLSAPCLMKFYNPRFELSKDELKLIFGETKEKESFTRFSYISSGNTFTLSKETPSVVESYTFTKN